MFKQIALQAKNPFQDKKLSRSFSIEQRQHGLCRGSWRCRCGWFPCHQEPAWHHVQQGTTWWGALITYLRPVVVCVSTEQRSLLLLGG